MKAIRLIAFMMIICVTVGNAYADFVVSIDNSGDDPIVLEVNVTDKDAGITEINVMKPSGFTTLEDWATAEYAVSAESMTTGKIYEYETLSFRTENGEFYLIEGKNNLVVLTTDDIGNAVYEADAIIEDDFPDSVSKRASCSDYKCNCVQYARCNVPSLPWGLWSYQDKVRTINSYSPRVGSVAIMNVGDYGHVGVVTSVYSNGKIKITEANYISCEISQRTNYPSNMSVTGYFRP